MNLSVRGYKVQDYEQLKSIYLDSGLYGGTFDEYRDGESTLTAKIQTDPEAILVAEQAGELLGSVSLIEDGRVAWLYRFAANRQDIAQALYKKAEQILRSRGHKEVLVYSDPKNEQLTNRYTDLGFKRGNDYVCFWRSLV